MKRTVSPGARALKETIRHLLREDGADAAAEPKEGDDSLDTQVDRYLGQYEGEAKTSKKEGRDFRMMLRRLLSEAGEDEDDDKKDDDKPADDDAGLGGDDPLGGDDDAAAPSKLGPDAIDIQEFANGVVRLIENYDSLLEVRSTLARRAINFIGKTYSPEVVESLKSTLRDDHGLVPGESDKDVSDEEFPAPAADRAGEGGAGGAPA